MFLFRYMRIRSIFELFVWFLISTSFEFSASNEVTEFGFKTDSWERSDTQHMMVITLWFGDTIYQVSSGALQLDTWYTFSNQSEPYFRVIGRNCSNLTQTKMMFELNDADAACVVQMYVLTQSGDWYGVNKTWNWRKNKFTHYLCIDNEPSEAAPFKQIIYFDTTRPNVYIADAAWRDGTNVDSRSNMSQCDPITTGTTQLTPKYGNSIGGDLYSVLNQGRVYAMLNWGLESRKYLQLRGWNADSQTASTDYGVGSSRSSCTSFTLSSDDYITGYQIWNDSIGISGLKFWTRNDRTLSCIGINGSNTTSYTNSYDYGTFNF
eukprot:107961_1